MTGLGIAITALSVAVLVVGFLRHKQRAFPSYGWVGVVIFVAAEWLMLRGVEPLATYFTPVAWTAYLMMVDAAVFAMTRHSRLRCAPRRLVHMAALSILRLL